MNRDRQLVSTNGMEIKKYRIKNKEFRNKKNNNYLEYTILQSSSQLAEKPERAVILRFSPQGELEGA
jgi:hypothetical protein